MKINTKLFCILSTALVFAEMLGTPISLIAAYVTANPLLRHFFKIPVTALVITSLIFHLYHPLKLFNISYVLLIFFPFFMLYGIFRNGLSYISIIHYGVIIMPIFMTSLGYQLTQYIYSNHTFRAKLTKITYLMFWIGAGTIALYFILHKAGIITYFGMSNSLHFFAAFFATSGNLPVYILTLFFIILSGKRTIILLGTFIGLAWWAKKLLTKKNRISIAKLCISLLILLLLLLTANSVDLQNNSIFRRFKSMANINLADKTSLYLSSSGRSTEIFSLFRYMNKDSMSWIIGNGAGASFIDKEIETTLRDYKLKKHYSHFTPMGYIFLGGVGFSLIIYLILTAALINGARQKLNLPFLLFGLAYIASFTGTNLFVDSKAWLSFGALRFYLQCNEPMTNTDSA